jgi:non-specific serine/threonine protein kinase
LRRFSNQFIQPLSRDPQSPAGDVLRKLVYPFILRRTKAQVATELPPKTETILFTEMLPRQRTLYEIVRDSYRGRILPAIERDGLEKCGMQVLEGLLRLRQICCHPLLADPQCTGESGKFQLLEKFILETVAEGHKILLFSQFVKALELMRQRLDELKIGTTMLTGQTHDREEVVNRFQSREDLPVFLISLKAGGVP